MKAQILSCAALAAALSITPAVAGKIIGNGRGCDNSNTEVNISSGKTGEQKQNADKTDGEKQGAAVQGKCPDKITVSNGQSKAAATVVAPQRGEASGKMVVSNPK